MYTFRMHHARFTFRPSALDIYNSVITFTYAVDLEDGKRIEYRDILEFPGTTPGMWRRIPAPLLSNLLEALNVMLGIGYWKIHCAPEMHTEGFSLTPEQAEFWNAVYTKGLGEFFYKAQIDFRGLISFPYDATGRTQKYPTRFVRSRSTLLANGGGKDSVVSAEMLKTAEIPFDLFVLGRTTKMQARVASVMGKQIISIVRRIDPSVMDLSKPGKIGGGYSVVSTFTFAAVLVAALQNYRYIILSNEQSADIPNVQYLGLDVNHQWSKSSEAEMLMRDYIARFITPDIIPFSLLRQFSEIEMVRRFAPHSGYFHAFSSCNMNFFLPRSITDNTRPDRAYWCRKCPKCIFIFACLTAFLPKEVVVDIFGANVYADATLLPTYKELLGLEGFKPFECVGTSEEMIVAMRRAQETGSYKGEPAMDLFEKSVAFDDRSSKEMEQRVFSAHGTGTMPEEFASFFGTDVSLTR